MDFRFLKCEIDISFQVIGEKFELLTKCLQVSIKLGHFGAEIELFSLRTISESKQFANLYK